MPRHGKKSPGLSLTELPTEALMKRLFPKKVVDKAKEIVHKPRSKKSSHKSTLPE